MSAVVVAGVVNVRAARRCESFPVPFASNVFDPGGVSIRLSGAGWTLARTLQELGSDVTFATYVGADELGQFAAQGMARHGLYGPTTLVCGSQPRAMVLYDEAGRRASTTDLRSTPDERYPVAQFESALAAGTWDAVVLTNIGFTRPLIPIARNRGIPIVTDLHLIESADCEYNRDWMAAAHLLACSHERLPIPPQQWIRLLWRKFGTDCVLVGCGADGALLGVRATRRIWHVAACSPRGIRYTSGAGDTLLGSFLHHCVELNDPLTAVRYAVLTAGWKIGGTPDDGAGVPRARLDELVFRSGLPTAVRL
jgi:sugar/nucleoside kinase (ribokinase family)